MAQTREAKTPISLSLTVPSTTPDIIMTSTHTKKSYLDKIKNTLLQQLLLIHYASTLMENPNAPELKSLDATQFDQDEVNKIQKYYIVKPVEGDFTKARQELIDNYEEKFSNLFQTFKTFLHEANILFNTRASLLLRVDERNNINKKIVLGALFNSYEQVTQCINLLENLRPDIQQYHSNKEKYLQASTSMPVISEANEEPDGERDQLAAELEVLNQSMDKILEPLVTSDFIKKKIKKLMLNSTDECMNYLNQVKMCTIVFSHFREFLKTLDKAGFFNVNDRRINFWSGTEAQKKADTVTDSVSNSNVPVFSVVSAIAYELKKLSMKSLSELLFFLLSSEYATHATGFVDLYSATASAGEGKAITIKNYHWFMEQEIYFILFMLKIAYALQVYYYYLKKVSEEGEEEKWEWVWTTRPDELYKDPAKFVLRRESDPTLSAEKNLEWRKFAEKYGEIRESFTLTEEALKEHYAFESSPKSSERLSHSDSPRGSQLSISGVAPSVIPSPRSLYKDVGRNLQTPRAARNRNNSKSESQSSASSIIIALTQPNVGDIKTEERKNANTSLPPVASAPVIIIAQSPNMNATILFTPAPAAGGWYSRWKAKRKKPKAIKTTIPTEDKPTTRSNCSVS